jgi:hypothetical protein
MKTCKTCKNTKSLNEFTKAKYGKMGVEAICKECVIKRNRTKYGVIQKIRHYQTASSKKRKHPAPSYTVDELYQWVCKQPTWVAIYTSWVNSNYSSKLKPSIDRINDYKPYTLYNIQLTTWEANNHRYHQDHIAGINNKQDTAVDMLNLNGQFIRRFHSISAASRHLKMKNVSEILAVCTGKPRKSKNRDGTRRLCYLKTSGGYKWRFSTQSNSDINDISKRLKNIT